MGVGHKMHMKQLYEVQILVQIEITCVGDPFTVAMVMVMGEEGGMQ